MLISRAICLLPVDAAASQPLAITTLGIFTYCFYILLYVRV